MSAAPPGRAGEVFDAFLKLGLMSFGGPIAHLGYFRAEFVERRGWLTEKAFADLVALCQFLPGPASSQTGFAIGLMRAGLSGGAAAWLGFTAPSAILLVLFAAAAGDLADATWGAGLLHGLKLAAVAIVAQAVLGMARSLCPDRVRASIAVAALAIVVAFSGSPGQLAAILAGAVAGLFLCRGEPDIHASAFSIPLSRRAALASLVLFVSLLALAAIPAGKGALGVFDAFYRSGALVFGGGHVVLPLLRNAVVKPGWVSDGAFLAGYGAAQAVPGPLFTFAAYLGFVAGGLGVALVALVAIFLPGLLLLIAALPFWQTLRARPSAQSAMQGVNAAVVGILAAALYDPVWTSAVLTPLDLAIAAAAFVFLIAWRAPPLLVVAFTALAGVAAAIA